MYIMKIFSTSILFLLSLIITAQEPPKEHENPRRYSYSYNKDGSVATRTFQSFFYRKSEVLIEENERSLVYPNPVNDYMVIELKDFQDGVQYQLSDNLGRVIRKDFLLNEISEIQFSELKKGIYFLTILFLDSKENITHQIIKK